MAGEIITAREGRVKSVNGISKRTRSFMTSTGNPLDAMLRRRMELASAYANTEPFNPSKSGPRNATERRNLERINRAAENMWRRNS